MSDWKTVSERPGMDVFVHKRIEGYCGDTDHIGLHLDYRRSDNTFWYQGLKFDSRKAWFDFVRGVNAANRKIKRAPKDEKGFPIFESEEASNE